MTGQDRAFALGCIAVRLVALVSLPSKLMSPPAMARPAPVAAAPQSLQTARIHTLAGASAKAVSLF